MKECFTCGIPDFYCILRLNPLANESEIKKAYKRLIKEYHPDRAKSVENSEDISKLLNQAFSILMDKNKRRVYDRFRAVVKNHQRLIEKSKELGIKTDERLVEDFEKLLRVLFSMIESRPDYVEEELKKIEQEMKLVEENLKEFSKAGSYYTATSAEKSEPYDTGARFLKFLKAFFAPDKGCLVLIFYFFISLFTGVGVVLFIIFLIMRVIEAIPLAKETESQRRRDSK